MKLEKNSKYFTIAVYAFGVIACAIVFFLALENFNLVKKSLKAFIAILSPFIWGFTIAYLLKPLFNILMKWGEKLFAKRKVKSPNLNRGLSITVTYVILLGFVSLFIAVIIPQLVNSISTIIDNFNLYVDTFMAWLNGSVIPLAQQYQIDTNAIVEYFTDLLTDFDKTLANVLPMLASFTSSLTGSIMNFIIGFVVSIYMLWNKEKLATQSKKILYAFTKESKADLILKWARFSDVMFSKFISGKILDSAIIMAISFVALSIMGMPFAILLSVIVGVLNIIPFFGPFIGAAICAFILLLIDPGKCLLFLIFVIILQQVDGNFIGPKILGDSTGLSPLWVMFAILVFGGMFGFTGMILGVPVFAILYAIVKEMVEKRLNKKNLEIQ